MSESKQGKSANLSPRFIRGGGEGREEILDEEEDKGDPGGDEYSLMPVSLMGEEGLGEGENEGRLVDLLGQTIVLIQVPGQQGRGDAKDKPSVQF